MKARALALCLSLGLVFFPNSNPNMARAQATAAPTYRTGLKSITIPPPTSDLNEIGSDYRVLLETTVPDSNRLIAAYMLAEDAANLHAGIAKGASRYAYIETSRRAEFAELDAASFKQIAAAVAQQFGAITDGSPMDIKAHEDELNHKLKAVGAKEVNFDKPVQLGELFSKPDACAFGMIMSISSNGAASVKMIAGMTVLRVQNRLLYAYVYSAYKDEESLRWVRTTSEQWADAILKANQQ
jgi:hypothetical protein